MSQATDLLLSYLPPYRDEWIVIHPDQTVKDIIKEVLDAHSEFRPDYDKIALYFEEPTTADITEGLYSFLKGNLYYREEGEDEQTTALPAGILIRGSNPAIGIDCKHFAGFTGGVLDALERLTGKKINWVYRFASYDSQDATPHHVFIVVKDGGRELWVDPTPGSEAREPVFYVDKKPNKMALTRNIAGMAAFPHGEALGIASLTVHSRPGWRINLMFQDAPWPYTWEPSSPFLGLDNYRDYSGDRNIGETALAAEINTAIQNGPDPGHTIDPAFVKWVYDNSIRSWNFYYKGGVAPDFDPSQYIPKTFSWTDSAGHRQTITPPLLVVTKDGRLAFDHDQPLDDYRNWLIHILTAWAQALINKYDATPYPLKPADLKNFSQAYTGNPNNPNASLFKEWRATSDVTKALSTVTTFVTNTFLKIVGAIPRNAFLALVGINLFRMATDLQNTINAGGWDKLAGKWQSLGGDPDKLRNTINHGAGQASTETTTGTINSPDQITGFTIGNPAVIAAVIAAAAPVVAALANYFTHSSVKPIAQSYVDQLNAANPAGHYSMVNGQLYSNGQPVNTTGETVQEQQQKALLKNGLIALAVGGVLYIALKKKGQRGKLLIPAGGALATFLILKYKSDKEITATTPPALIPQAVPTTTPTTATPGILPIIQQLPGILTPILTKPVLTPTTPTTAGSNLEIPGSQDPGLYAV